MARNKKRAKKEEEYKQEYENKNEENMGTSEGEEDGADRNEDQNCRTRKAVFFSRVLSSQWVTDCMLSHLCCRPCSVRRGVTGMFNHINYESQALE